MLRTGAATAIAATAGCLGTLRGGSDADPDEWLVHRFDAANRGVQPAASPPRGSLEQEWSYRYELDDNRHRGAQSSSIVVDGAVVTTHVEFTVDAIDMVIVSLDLESGDEQWTFRVEEVADRFVTTQPVTDGEFVYWTGLNQRTLGAVDLETGEEVWKQVADAPLGDPTIVDDLLYVASNTLLAFDPRTGEEVWPYEANERYGDVAYWANGRYPPTIGGETAYVTAGNRVFAVDATFGVEQWRREIDFFDETLDTSGQASAPAATDGALYLTCGDPFQDGDGVLVALDPEGGEEEWRFQPEPDAEPDRTASEGEEVPPGVGPYWTPTPADDTVYVTGREYDEYYLYAVSATDGSLEWREPLPGLAYAPVLADGVVYVTGWWSDEELIRCHDAADGEHLGGGGASSRIRDLSEPIPLDDRVVVSVDGGVASFVD